MSHIAEDVFVYQAQQQFCPNPSDQQQNCIPLDPGDRLEVSTDSAGEMTSIEEPQGWVMGRNRTKNLTGYFPGSMVKYVGQDTSFNRPSNYMRSQSHTNDDSGYAGTPGGGKCHVQCLSYFTAIHHTYTLFCIC